MKAIFISIFPKLIDSLTQNGVISRALEKTIINYEIINPIDFLEKNERVDDKPYGGGPGMLMRSDPLEKSVILAKDKTHKKTKVIYLSPQGSNFSQKKSRELSKEENLIFICGRYEGIDQRIIDNYVDEEISIGDYVLTGGELPALVVFDAIVRNIEGVLGDFESIDEESHSNNMIEYPQFTRPEKNDLGSVPEVLTSGNHKKIDEWRRKQSLGKTFTSRPDIFPSSLNEKDFSLLEEFLSDLGYDSDRIAALIDIYKIK